MCLCTGKELGEYIQPFVPLAEQKPQVFRSIMQHFSILTGDQRCWDHEGSDWSQAVQSHPGSRAELTDFPGQEMTYSQGLGWGTDREHHLGLEAPISPEDLVICDPNLVAHSHFLGDPHQPVSLLCPSKPNSSGDPTIIHVPFLSLRGLIEGEQEISLVLGQPQQGLMQCHILGYLKRLESGCLPDSPAPPPSPLQDVSHFSDPHLLIFFSYLLLAREEPGFLTAAPQGQVLQNEGLHSLHLHSPSLLHPANIFEVVPEVEGAGSGRGICYCPFQASL